MSLQAIGVMAPIGANLAMLVSVLLFAVQARLGIQMLKDAAQRNHIDKAQSLSWIRGLPNLLDWKAIESNFKFIFLAGGDFARPWTGEDARGARANHRAAAAGDVLELGVPVAHCWQD